MSFSDYLEAAVLDHVFDQGDYAQPAHYYVALSLADPGETGAGLSEPVGIEYARVETHAADWTRAANVVSNNAAVTFPAPATDWGMITHVAIMDAAAAGNVLMSTPLALQQNVTSTSIAPSFPIGDITVTLT